MPFSWAFEPAVHTCYRPLPQLFLNQLEIPINWHWGAPLLQMLNWKYPEVIQLIKRGMESGQFKILGSSYSQNVMYNNSEWMNNEQIQLNRSIIELILDGHYPTGFWNSERVWDERLGPLIVKNDYNYTLVENPILKPNDPYNAHHLYQRTYKVDGVEKKLHILPDSRSVLKLVDTAILKGDFESLFTYLDKYADSEKKDTVYIYAQDAEATGFWQYGRGLPYEKSFDNLIELVQRILDRDWIKIMHLEDVIENYNAIEMDKIERGQADWMLNSVQEDGFGDYFEFVERAPELQYFDPLMNEAENLYGKEPKNQKNIFQELKRSALSFTFEYGCAPGQLGREAVNTRYLMNVPGKMTIEGLRFINFLEKLRKTGPSELSIDWIKSPAGNPLVFYNNQHFGSLWSHYGGRCVVLFNWDLDTIISPNLPFYNSEQQLTDLFRYNPPFHFPEFGHSMNYGGNLFEDQIKVDGKSIGTKRPIKYVFNRTDHEEKIQPIIADSYFSVQIIPFFKIIRFWYKMPKLVFVKEVKHQNNSLNVQYTYFNPSRYPIFMSSTTSSTFSPKSWDLMNNISSLNISEGGEILLDGDLICKINKSEGVTHLGSSMFGKIYSNYVQRNLKPDEKINVTYELNF